MEKVIAFYRRETNPDQKYFVKSTNLLHMFVCHSKKTEFKAQEDSKRLLVEGVCVCVGWGWSSKNRTLKCLPGEEE